MQTYLRLIGYLRPHLGLLLVSFVLMVAFAVTDLFSLAVVIPFLQVLFGQTSEPPTTPPEGILERAEQFFTRDMFAWLTEPTALGTLANVCLLVLAIYFLKTMLGYFQQFLPHILLERTLKELRNELFSHLQQLSFRYYQRTRAGHLLSIMASEVQMLSVAISTGLFKVAQHALEAAFTLAFLLMISWRLTLYAVVVLPPITWIVVRIASKLRRVNRERLRKLGDVTSALQENVAGIRIVKAFGAEQYERDRFGRDNEEYTRNIVRSKKYSLMGSPSSEFLLAGAVVVILYIGGRMILLEHSLEAGPFIAFLLGTLKLSSPVKYLSRLNEDVQPALAACERIFGILDTQPEVEEIADPVPLPEFRDQIEYDHVSFAYDDRDGPVLHDVSFTVRKGEVVALVGPSGGGKSTLVDLLPRFYDPIDGRILFDDVDLRRARLRDLRDHLGIVTQEVILFHDTVSANIAYGTRADQKDLAEAARAANALDFINALPDGFETVIGERGVRLSGGQRQRIAIARAIYKNPPILIFDEATSALDTESERLVQQAIARLMENRTVIVIAHRLSTVQRADQIIVIEGGRVIERGTHGELLESEGRYSQLYELQFADLPA
jgi:subfamily B ATP-binding cassette protein MsbA